MHHRRTSSSAFDGGRKKEQDHVPAPSVQEKEVNVEKNQVLVQVDKVKSVKTTEDAVRLPAKLALKARFAAFDFS